MQIEANQSNLWTTVSKKGVRWNLSQSMGRLFSYVEILKFGGGVESFIKKIQDEVMSYGPSYGSGELRDAIAAIYGSDISWQSVLVTAGCRKANFLAYYTFLEPGDEVIIVTPTWWPIMAIPPSFSARIKFLKTKVEDAFVPDPDEIRKLITDKTKMIVLTNPNNPGGSIMSREDLQGIVSVAEKHGIWILCDEIYKGIESNTSVHFPSIADLYDRGLATNSLSKVVGIPGVRIGWITGGKAAIEEMKIRWKYICFDTSILDQSIGLIAMTNYNTIMDLQRNIAVKNRQIIESWLESEPLITCPIRLEAGTTAFLQCHNDMDTRKLATALLEKSATSIVPGIVYDNEGAFNNFFRIGYMSEAEKLEEGINNISAIIHSMPG